MKGTAHGLEFEETVSISKTEQAFVVERKLTKGGTVRQRVRFDELPAPMVEAAGMSVPALELDEVRFERARAAAAPKLDDQMMAFLGGSAR